MEEKLIEAYSAALSKHVQLAAEEQEEYKTCITQSQSTFKEFQPNTVMGRQLCASNEAVISCDYQMGKLIPHWG